MIVLEAMAPSNAAVAAQLEGYREVIREGSEGWLVPPCQSGARAEAICSLVADAAPRQAMGLPGRERAAVFASPQVARRMPDSCQVLLVQNRKPRLHRSGVYRAKGC